MNFDFSEEQEHLRGEARRFLEARCGTALVRSVLDDPSRSHDEGLWAALVAQGWTALAIPESHGGLGLGPVHLCVLAEELGRAIAPVPFASTVYILAQALMMAGSDSQKALLRDIAAGTCIGCLAVGEGPGGFAAGAVETVVRDGRLSGTKLPVVDGLAATTALVLAREEGAPGTRLFLVDLAGAGVERAPLGTIDPARDAARLRFDAAPCTPIGDAGLLDRLLDRAAVLLAFEQVGGADRCLEQAVDYAKLRYAFGRPIGSQQAIKHKLADLYVKNQIARSNAYYGAWAFEAGSDELPAAAAAARIAATDAYWEASRENIQTHGGVGFTWESDCHLFHRRALQTGMVLDSVGAWRGRLVRALEARPAGDA